MKRKVLLMICMISILPLVGCTKKKESFEDKVIRKFTYVDSAQKQLEATVEDLTSQVKMLRAELGISSTPAYTDNEINFSSIKIAAKSVANENNTIVLKENSEFNLKVDIMNSTDENLSQLTCQTYVTYKRNGQYYDRHLLDAKFDVLPKSVRKQIEFKSIPTKESDVEHLLTIIIKDLNGNTITTFEKKLTVKKG